MTFGDIFDGCDILDIVIFFLWAAVTIHLTISFIRNKIRDRKEEESPECSDKQTDSPLRIKRIGKNVELVTGPANWYEVECWYCGSKYRYESSYIKYDEADGDHNTECPWCHKLNEHSSEYGIWGEKGNEPRES